MANPFDATGVYPYNDGPHVTTPPTTVDVGTMAAQVSAAMAPKTDEAHVVELPGVQ